MPIKKVVIPPTNETEGTILQRLGDRCISEEKTELGIFFQMGFKSVLWHV